MSAPAPELAPRTDDTADVLAAVEAVEAVEVVEQDLLVEDVSIDGMCGVY